MQKNPPSLFRILAMVFFSLSCIGLLLFLWLSFGGAIPLKPKRYELKIDFPEATTLAEQADVRIAGVTVGKVQQKKLDVKGNATKVTLQIDPKYAPVAKDTRAILRQKTLLGETYVELTPGDKKRGTIKDGATLARKQIEPTVELDEILRIFDPDTKKAFRQWVAQSAQQIKDGGGEDLNSALGNLGQFAQDGAGVLAVLNNQETALRDVVRNTGVVFSALNERYGQLHDLILNSNATFSATAAQQQALARTFEIFPTFLDESRLTLARLERFAINTHPLVNALKPVADDLGPTIRDLGATGPDLENLFRRLRPVIAASPRDLPQAARFLRGASPLFDALTVFLPQLNPILSYANWNEEALGGFIGDGVTGFYYKLPQQPDAPGVPRYMLAQAGTITTGQSTGFFPTRPLFDRGNAYNGNNALRRAEVLGVIESFDCRSDHPDGNGTTDPVGRDKPLESPPGGEDQPPCFVQPPQLFNQSPLRYPHVPRGYAPFKPAPFRITPPAMPPYSINP